MSNLLKSKFLLGAMIVAIMFVGVVAFDATPAAADCSITSTLRVGSKGDQVKCLQTIVGATADGSFGPLTKAAVMAWQSGRSLVADGVVGPLTRAALLGGAVSGNFPAGCSSASGYSSTTGVKCDSVQANTFPAGCTSASVYSPTTGASCSTGAVAGQTGPVSASLASDNPASGYIIGGQATADLAHFTFSGVGTLNTVVLQRTGVSDQNTLSSVYLYDGATRLTDGYSFNNSGQLTMNSLGVAVNGSKTLSVKADVAVVTNASSLGITLVSFIAVGNSSVTANVKGNEMTYGVGNLASVYVAANPSAGGTATVNAGTSAYTVWSAPVQVNVRAVWLKGANFRLTGSAPADALGNIKLFVDGVQVGTAATMGTITGSNYAMFDFAAAPVSLSTGTHTVDLRADVVNGSSANYSGTALTFTLGSQMIIPAGTDSYIEIKGDLQNSDSINYTGGTVSAALNGLTNNAQGQTSKTNVSFPATTGTNTSGVNLTIQTGVLAVSKNTGYASQSVSPNSDNVKLGSFVLQNQSSSESVRVTSLAMTLFTGAGATMTSGTTPALTNFLNLRTSETSGSGAQPIQPSASNTFSVDFTIAPGATKTIDVLASTGSTVGGASMLTKLVVTSLGSSSNVSVSQNGDAAAVTGQTITLAVGTLTNPPTLLTAPSTAQQFVPAANGATNATKAVFKILASGGSATISELKFTVNSQDFSAATTDTGANSLEIGRASCRERV